LHHIIGNILSIHLLFDEDIFYIGDDLHLLFSGVLGKLLVFRGKLTKLTDLLVFFEKLAVIGDQQFLHLLLKPGFELRRELLEEERALILL
jgi:hypothetical protein